MAFEGRQKSSSKNVREKSTLGYWQTSCLFCPFDALEQASFSASVRDIEARQTQEFRGKRGETDNALMDWLKQPCRLFNPKTFLKSIELLDWLFFWVVIVSATLPLPRLDKSGQRLTDKKFLLSKSALCLSLPVCLGVYLSFCLFNSGHSDWMSSLCL